MSHKFITDHIYVLLWPHVLSFTPYRIIQPKLTKFMDSVVFSATQNKSEYF